LPEGGKIQQEEGRHGAPLLAKINSLQGKASGHLAIFQLCSLTAGAIV
jgi:hypothetical protein